MRFFYWTALLFLVCPATAQQPILTHRATLNAASLAPFGLPNAPLARGGVFTIFGESLGPVQPQSVSAFPLGTDLAGVSLSLTQADKTMVAAIPLFVSPSQINAILPSTAKAGLASLRVTYQGRKSNAIPIQIEDSGPGIFAISSGGYGPGVVQNFVAADNQPINSLNTPAAPGQTITIWATGLGPVNFSDNVAPQAGDVAALVSITIGGKLAGKLYSGRAPCCSGVDQIVATIPNDAPLGCWVPLQVKAGGVVSNTVTIAIAAKGSATCSDASNPLSSLERAPGTQGFVHIQRVDSISDVTSAPVATLLDNLYARFITPSSPDFAFDPYLSYPPAGSCLVHQTSGDANVNKSLRGAVNPGVALSPKPVIGFNNGVEDGKFFGDAPSYSSITLGGTVGGNPLGLALANSAAKLTVDGIAMPLKLVAPPQWDQRDALTVINRSVPLVLNFLPGDPTAPTAIVIYSYAAYANATVEVQCLAGAGSSSFTVPAAVLANLPQSYRTLDGSYTQVALGTLSPAGRTIFTTPRVENGLLLFSSWISSSVVMQ